MLAPIPYFAWRMGKPLSHGEFNGLTYFQFVEWRKIAFRNQEIDFQTKHPDADVKLGTCEAGHLVITLPVLVVQAATYTYAGFKGTPPTPIYPYPEDVDLLNFLPKWWETYEHLFWYNEIQLGSLAKGPANSVCIISEKIPSPSDFEIMKREQKTNISESK
jgi:hypothetical protein